MCAEQYLRRLHGTRKRTCKHFPRVLWHTYIKFARSVLSKVSARFNLARNARQTRLVCSGHRPLLCLLQVLYSTIIAKRLFRFALNILPHPALSLALPTLPSLSLALFSPSDIGTFEGWALAHHLEERYYPLTLLYCRPTWQPKMQHFPFKIGDLQEVGSPRANAVPLSGQTHHGIDGVRALDVKRT